MTREVPDFDVKTFGDRNARYCCTVFVINEGQRLLAQLERMRPHTADVDVVIADGGSTDGSTGRSELAPRDVRALLVKKGKGRLGAQMRMAFAWALDQGYDGVITIDGSNKDDPSAIPSFKEALERGVDHIQGSRFIEGGRAVHTPWPRLLGLKLVHAPLIRQASGFPYTDTTNGFRGYSRRFLSDPRVAPFRRVFAGYELHYYLAIRAGELGFVIQELPVTRCYPAKGPTPTKIKPVRGAIEVLRALSDVCRHRLDPVTAPGKDAP